MCLSTWCWLVHLVPLLVACTSTKRLATMISHSVFAFSEDPIYPKGHPAFN
jgi:hypothetical protein